MTDEEFGSQAADLGAQLVSFDRRDRIAAASRGSANPAALAWLAEGLHVGHATCVVDLVGRALRAADRCGISRRCAAA